MLFARLGWAVLLGRARVTLDSKLKFKALSVCVCVLSCVYAFLMASSQYDWAFASGFTCAR